MRLLPDAAGGTAGLGAAVGPSWASGRVGSQSSLLGNPPDAVPGSFDFWFYIAGSCVLVAVAGLMSGLTLGLLSLDTVDLEMILRGPESRQKKYARGIQPLMKDSHRLLVTLVLCNAAAMEALPMLVDRLTSPLISLILSVTVVLLFGEIMPQAVCSRYGLAVGYYSAWFVRIMLFVTFPISWPISQVLNAVIGGTHGSLYRRAELRSLMDIYRDSTARDGAGRAEFSEGELNVLKGALDLAHKPAHRAMTPLGRVFMLDTNAVLDHATLSRIVESGFSRIPIHVPGSRGDIVGLLMVKELALVDPCRATPVADMVLRSAPRVFDDTSLQDLLDLFQTGRSHMALLVQRFSLNGDGFSSDYDSGNDATPRTPEMEGDIEAPLVRKRSFEPKDVGQGRSNGQGHYRKHRNHSPRGAASDSSCSVCDIAEDITDTRALELLRTGQVVGVITMEDVIEELLQEEILDETDQYLDNNAETKVTAAVLATLVPPRLRDALQKSFVVRKGRLARSVARNENIEATTDLEIEQQMFYRNRLLTKTALNGPTASTPVLLESGDACVSDRPLTGINAEISREGSRASRRPPRLVVHNDPVETAARHGLLTPSSSSAVALPARGRRLSGQGVAGVHGASSATECVDRSSACCSPPASVSGAMRQNLEGARSPVAASSVAAAEGSTTGDGPSASEERSDAPSDGGGRGRGKAGKRRGAKGRGRHGAGGGSGGLS